MKTKVLTAVLAAALALPLSACSGSSGDSASSASRSGTGASAGASSASGFETAGGVLTATDPEANLSDGAGVRITIEPGATGKATFQLIDPASGSDYSDCLVFDYAERTFVRHHDVAARGAAYDYTMSLDDQTLIAITDEQGDDASEAVRRYGRWDSAQTETADLLTTTQRYFQDKYGTTIEEQVVQG
ncbi:hypothetical protein [uncultured Propionibacterium sp.]|uniref:hypothetical protein n=1 Tax=uncultured Propionibacterium sp. TaxID=218066 RepID=UPI00292E8F15|nr:hypothetical protein [uncultured Propionibacterium sp.]